LTLELHKVLVFTNLVGLLVSDSLEHGKVIKGINQVLHRNLFERLDVQNFAIQVNNFVPLNLVDLLDVFDLITLVALCHCNDSFYRVLVFVVLELGSPLLDLSLSV